MMRLPPPLAAMLNLLLLIAINPEHKALLLERFHVVEALDPAARAAALAAHGAEIDLVLTNGSTGFRADEVAACPRHRHLQRRRHQ
jgi:hypothetical protein